MLGARGGGVRPATRYRRDRVTWAAFAILLAFGVLNAGLGPALPYLRRAEHVSYLASVLHQVGFAIGGGLAGAFSARAKRMPARALAIRGGLGCAALAWLAVGYGDRLAITVAATFTVSLLATTALIRVWALLADEHGERRAVAMSEGEVAVSLGGVISPLLVSLSAATVLGWRGAFVFASALVFVAVAATLPVQLPQSVLNRTAAGAVSRAHRARRTVQPTLLIVFAIVALEFSLTFWLASYLGDDVGQSRQSAAAMVSVMYLANLVGRLLASRLARVISAERLLATALALTLLGLPVLLAANGAGVAVVGLAVIGTGIGGTFPLTSALHIAGSPRDAEGALGQVLATAAAGEIVGPVVVAAIAQQFDLRIGLLTLVGLTLLAVGALRWHLSRQ